MNHPKSMFQLSGLHYKCATRRPCDVLPSAQPPEQPLKPLILSPDPTKTSGLDFKGYVAGEGILKPEALKPKHPYSPKP